MLQSTPFDSIVAKKLVSQLVFLDSLVLRLTHHGD